MTIHTCPLCGQKYERWDYSIFWDVCDRCKVLEGYSKGKLNWSGIPIYDMPKLKQRKRRKSIMEIKKELDKKWKKESAVCV